LYKSYDRSYSKTSNIYDLHTYGDFLSPASTVPKEAVLNSIIDNNLCENLYNKNMTIPKNNINNGCTFLLSFTGYFIIHFMDSAGDFQPTYYTVIIMVSDSLKKEPSFYLVDYAHFYNYGGDWSAAEKINMNFTLPVHFENNNVLSRIDVIFAVDKTVSPKWPLVIDRLHKFNIDYIGVEY
jgi:hypothetical protein